MNKRELIDTISTLGFLLRNLEKGSPEREKIVAKILELVNLL